MALKNPMKYALLLAALATAPISVSNAAETVTPGNSSSDVTILPVAAGTVEVSAKKGPVTRLNLGNGLVDASVGDALKVGDEVFAGANSSVTLYFAVPGCSYTIPAGSVYKVTDTPPCKAPAAAQNGSPGVPPEGVAPGVILAGGAAAAGAVALVVLIANSDDGDGGGNNNPATPD